MASSLEDDGEWEYEYDPEETKDFYVILDLTASLARPKPRSGDEPETRQTGKKKAPQESSTENARAIQQANGSRTAPIGLQTAAGGQDFDNPSLTAPQLPGTPLQQSAAENAAASSGPGPEPEARTDSTSRAEADSNEAASRDDRASPQRRTKEGGHASGERLQGGLSLARDNDVTDRGASEENHDLSAGGNDEQRARDGRGEEYPAQEAGGDSNASEDGGGQEEPEKIEIVDLHGANPIVRYQDQVFSCHWASTLGSDLCFIPREEAAAAATGAGYTPVRTLKEYDLVAPGRLKLVANNARMEPRAPRKQKAADPEEEYNSSDEMVMFGEEEEPLQIVLDETANAAKKRQADFLERFSALRALKGESTYVPTKSVRARLLPEYMVDPYPSQAAALGEDGNGSGAEETAPAEDSAREASGPPSDPEVLPDVDSVNPESLRKRRRRRYRKKNADTGRPQKKSQAKPPHLQKSLPTQLLGDKNTRFKANFETLLEDMSKPTPKTWDELGESDDNAGPAGMSPAGPGQSRENPMDEDDQEDEDIEMQPESYTGPKFRRLGYFHRYAPL